MVNKKRLYENIMKDVSKTIKKHLNEATYNDTDRDTMRLNSIVSKSNGNNEKMCLYAFNMAKSITNMDKLESRYNIAVEMFGEEHPIAIGFNAVLNQEEIPGELLYVPEALLKKADRLNHKYCIDLHKEDREFFYICDHTYWVYAPDTIFTDFYEDLPGVVLIRDYIADHYQIDGTLLYDEDNLTDKLFDEYYITSYLDGFSRATVDELIEYGYTPYDNENEDIDTFKELPLELQKEFVKKYLNHVKTTKNVKIYEETVEILKRDGVLK